MTLSLDSIPQPPSGALTLETPALAVVDLWKAYGNNQALQGTSFVLNQGERLALLGPNGAGKTSLIRIINQITGPDSGELYFNGERLQQKQLD